MYMYETEILIDQNGGEYKGSCQVSTNEVHEITQVDYQTVKLALHEGIEVTLKFDERIEI